MISPFWPAEDSEESPGPLVNIPWGCASRCQPVKKILIYTRAEETGLASEKQKNICEQSSLHSEALEDKTD